MGNSSNKPQQKSVTITTIHKQIILHYTYKIKLTIGYSSTFPHNFQGLKLWDANIAMARYVIMNTHKFKDYSVLQLPTGTGIAGISVRKWTQAKKLVMVDLSEQVVGNAKNNCLRNKVEGYVAAKMRWDEYASFNSKYDVILASDPFFHRCSPALMVKITEHFLAPGGTLILAAPNTEMLHNFLKLSEEGKFQVSREKINSEQFMSSPTYNQVEGEKQFPQLCKGEILIYAFVNKKYGKIFSQEKKQMETTNVQKNLQIEQRRVHESETKQIKEQHKQPPMSRIAQANQQKVSRQQKKINEQIPRVEITVENQIKQEQVIMQENQEVQNKEDVRENKQEIEAAIKQEQKVIQLNVAHQEQSKTSQHDGAEIPQDKIDLVKQADPVVVEERDTNQVEKVSQQISQQQNKIIQVEPVNTLRADDETLNQTVEPQKIPQADPPSLIPESRPADQIQQKSSDVQDNLAANQQKSNVETSNQADCPKQQGDEIKLNQNSLQDENQSFVASNQVQQLTKNDHAPQQQPELQHALTHQQKAEPNIVETSKQQTVQGQCIVKQELQTQNSANETMKEGQEETIKEETVKEGQEEIKKEGQEEIKKEDEKEREKEEESQKQEKQQKKGKKKKRINRRN